MKNYTTKILALFILVVSSTTPALAMGHYPDSDRGYGLGERERGNHPWHDHDQNDHEVDRGMNKPDQDNREHSSDHGMDNQAR